MTIDKAERFAKGHDEKAAEFTAKAQEASTVDERRTAATNSLLHRIRSAELRHGVHDRASKR